MEAIQDSGVGMVINCNELGGTLIPKPFERFVKIVMAPETQPYIKDISISMGYFSPHCSNDLHIHEEGAELIYIISGYGKTVIGDQTFDIGPNSMLINPKGVWHQQINESDTTMQLLAIWVPAVSGDSIVSRAVKSAQNIHV